MKQTKIILKELAFFARHGLTDEEAKLGQRFKVDVVAQLDPSTDYTEDTAETTVNYVSIYECVQSIFENARYNLIEACAEAIASALLERFNSIESVTVTVKKPSVPVNCICEYFAAEVTLCR
tara:strand:- start:23 stop:388 length:366 start_codon:yes stop_codon:yes gene_type:complete